MRYRVARGIFSNEAGLGSASIVHAQARNTPAGQGLWGIWEVLMDTLIIGIMTALVILVTGVLPTGTTSAENSPPPPSPRLCQALAGSSSSSPSSSSPTPTMLTWCCYGEKSFEYLLGEAAVRPYRLVFLAFIPVGAMGGPAAVWEVADTLNGVMAAPNLIALIALGGVVAKERTELMAQLPGRTRRAKD